MGKKMPSAAITFKGVSPDARWYTIVTKFNYEKKYARDVMAGLKNSGMDAYVYDVVVPIKETKKITKTKIIIISSNSRK